MRLLVAVSIIVIALASVASVHAQVASCVLRGLGGRAITGSVNFERIGPGQVRVTTAVSGLAGTSNAIGIHVHQYGDTSSEDGVSAGDHWNPTGNPHGCPPTASRHVGDMGNWTVNAGVINQVKDLDLLSLDQSSSSNIVGRAVIVHQNVDQCNGSAGQAGPRIAACVIGISNRNPPTTTLSAPNGITNALAYLQGTSNCPECTGRVWMQASGSGVRVTGQFFFGNDFRNGSRPLHGLHVHQFGDITLANGSSPGPHWSSAGNSTSHGLPPVADRHLGDWGNIAGSGWYQYTNTDPGAPALSAYIGRTWIVHMLQDHGRGEGCDQTGNSGLRIMQGVIGVGPDAMSVPTPPAGSFLDSFQDKSCVSTKGGGNDANPGLIVGLIIAGIAAFALLLLIIGALIFFLGRNSET